MGNIIKSIADRPETLSQEILSDLRRQIDDIDDRLMDILAQRMAVAREIGRLKQENNMPVVQPERYNSLISNRVETAAKLGLNADFTKRILAEIHEESVGQQLNLQKPSQKSRSGV